MRPATYWHCGGDLVARPCFILDDADAQALRGAHLDEARAALCAGDRGTARRALTLVHEINRALNGARRWRRASGPVLA